MTGVHFGGLGFVRGSQAAQLNLQTSPTPPPRGLKLGDESVRSRTGAEMEENILHVGRENPYPR